MEWIVLLLLIFALTASRMVWAASTLYHFSLCLNFQMIGWFCSVLSVVMAYTAGRLYPH